MKTRVIFAFICVFLITQTSLLSLASWTIFIEIQAKNDLDNSTKKNLQEMAAANYNSDVEVIVQWHRIKHKEVSRYRIKHNKLELLGTFSHETCVESLVDGATYAFDNYPSRYKALILSGHASGIYDPPAKTKGILFDYENNTYMNNQELVKALYEIKLKSGKLDILGMDSCLMAMLEVAYEVSDYSEYLIASEDVSPGTGWRYTEIINSISSYPASPIDFAVEVLSSFAKHYKELIGWYTLSAINLNKVIHLKINLDKIIESIFECLESDSDRELTISIIRLARMKSTEFRSNKYIDLYSFYKEMIQEINCNLSCSNEAFFNLEINLKAGRYLIKAIVEANVKGEDVKTAEGLSIYFPPLGHINFDDSYPITDFCQNSKWLSLIELI